MAQPACAAPPTSGPLAGLSWRWAALGLIAVLNFLDVATTLALPHLREANPLAAILLDHGLLPGAKLATVAAVVMLGLMAPARRWIDPALWCVAAVYTVVVANNVALLV